MADSRKEIQDDNNHWDKLFKLCAYVIGCVIIYCFLITFVPIPKDNIETARQVLIFFIGTLVGYCFNLLSPGITSKKSVPSQLNVTGDNTSIGGTTTTDIDLTQTNLKNRPKGQRHAAGKTLPCHNVHDYSTPALGRVFWKNFLPSLAARTRLPGTPNLKQNSVSLPQMQLTDSITPTWEKGYNNYGPWLRDKYKGQRVFKVIVDGGFTCPNRDGSKGYGGCTYCNVDSFTPSVSRNAPTVREQVIQGMERARKGNKADKFIIYFQPNTNTYAPAHYLKMMYDEALSYGTEDIVGLSIGTRPDCIDMEKIALLESYTDRFDVDLEMGMESIYNDTLAQINRGCNHEELIKALKLVENTKLDICVHTIFGFPWETHDMMLKYADEINRFPQIKFVKFHHLHIVEGSVMGVKYKREPFKVFGIDEYADFLCELLPRVRPDIVIQRLFGLSDRELLIAPNWGLKKSEIQYYIDQRILSRGVVQGSSLT